MLNYVVCECTPLVDTLVYCAPVRLSDGDLDAIYLGPSGVFAIAQGDLDSDAVYLFLRDYLGTTRVEVYHDKNGRYNAAGGLTNEFLTSQELDSAIYQHTTQGPMVWDADALETVQKKIRILDGINRGVYCDDDGNWYLARGKQFYPCSNFDADRIFRLGLFGGVLGMHRFAVGKWFTGLIYLLTGGLIGCGWILDVLQMLNGGFKDRKKRLLSKPARLRPAWYIVGMFCGLILFSLFSFFMGFLTGTFDQITHAAQNHVDEETALWLISLMKALSGK